AAAASSATPAVRRDRRHPQAARLRGALRRPRPARRASRRRRAPARLGADAGRRRAGSGRRAHAGLDAAGCPRGPRHGSAGMAVNPLPNERSIATYQAMSGLLKAGLNVPEAAARVAPDFGITETAAAQRFYRVLKFEQATSPTPPETPPRQFRRDVKRTRSAR